MKMMNTLFLIFCVFWSMVLWGSPPIDQVKELPGYGKVDDLEFAGHVPSSSLFYWYVASQHSSSNTPLVLWLNGGPGYSSLYGFFIENGPYQVNTNGTLSKRDHSWTKEADYLIFDQPSGVGYSFGGANNYNNEAEAINQLFQGLKYFFKQHPSLASKPIYLAGESYAGKYLPQLAVQMIEDKSKQKINLKGLLIGDGWVNPLVQQKSNIDYAYYHGLIDDQARKNVMKLYEQCRLAILEQTPSSRRANQVCEKIQGYIKKTSGDLNLNNIEKNSEPDESAMIHYLNRPDVRHALHVNVGLKNYLTFSSEVANALEVGEQDPVDHLYAKLLDSGIPVLIYNGLEDGKDSNFLSTDLWLRDLHWSHQKEFNKATTCVWHVAGQVAGYAKSLHGLNQLKIRGAGHLAPVDQPERVLDLLHRFINHQTFCK